MQHVEGRTKGHHQPYTGTQTAATPAMEFYSEESGISIQYDADETQKCSTK